MSRGFLPDEGYSAGERKAAIFTGIVCVIIAILMLDVATNGKLTHKGSDDDEEA